MFSETIHMYIRIIKWYITSKQYTNLNINDYTHQTLPNITLGFQSIIVCIGVHDFTLVLRILQLSWKPPFLLLFIVDKIAQLFLCKQNYQLVKTCIHTYTQTCRIMFRHLQTCSDSWGAQHHFNPYITTNEKVYWSNVMRCSVKLLTVHRCLLACKLTRH